MNEAFRRFSHTAARFSGTAGAFTLALTVVIVWAITGPIFNFSDTWQLVINTGTTVVTFLMVFLIQNTQNRDSLAIHAKLDELVISLHGADNRLVHAEELSDADLDLLRQHYHDLAESVGSPAARRPRARPSASRTKPGPAARPRTPPRTTSRGPATGRGPSNGAKP